LHVLQYQTGDNRTIEQLIKQLYKLLNVQKVQDVNTVPNVSRELMLLKVFISNTFSEILDKVKVLMQKL
jgi:acetolactate synthase-1/3 small subunit